MSFLYPRVASIYRPNSQLSASGGAGQGQPSQSGGAGTYFGPKAGPVAPPSQAGEGLIQAGVSCSIQGTTGRATGTGELPADAPGPSRWKILIPLRVCPMGTILIGDIIVDDQGRRFQVSADYWNSMGWCIEAVRLKN